MFSGVQPRVRRSEPGRQSAGGGRGTPGAGRPVSGIKPPGHRQNYRQERLEDEFSNQATMARRAMVIAREVCLQVLSAQHCVSPTSFFYSLALAVTVSMKQRYLEILGHTVQRMSAFCLDAATCLPVIHNAVEM